MCGRFALFAPPHKLKDLFGVDNLLNLPPRYNAAPLQELPIIIKNRMGMARWGFVPEWAAGDDKSMAAKMINARSETVAEKPSFRASWTHARRCLIPASGFYEWRKDETSGVNQPYYIYNEQQECMAFAGLWAKNGDLVTFTILTKEADGGIARLHHRMPVMLSLAQTADWFAADERGAVNLIARASGAALSYHAVGPDVGKVAHDHDGLIRDVKAA